MPPLATVPLPRAGRGVAREGIARLEVAVPVLVNQVSGVEDGSTGLMGRMIIGVDPHRASVTIEVSDEHGRLAATSRGSHRSGRVPGAGPRTTARCRYVRTAMTAAVTLRAAASGARKSLDLLLADLSDTRKLRPPCQHDTGTPRDSFPTCVRRLPLKHEYPYRRGRVLL